jgi:hypothetical protein
MEAMNQRIMMSVRSQNVLHTIPSEKVDYSALHITMVMEEAIEHLKDVRRFMPVSSRCSHEYAQMRSEN